VSVLLAMGQPPSAGGWLYIKLRFTSAVVRWTALLVLSERTFLGGHSSERQAFGAGRNFTVQGADTTVLQDYDLIQQDVETKVTC